MYSEILPKVAALNHDVTNCVADMIEFRTFLKNTDYDLLFKASKMVL